MIYRGSPRKIIETPKLLAFFMNVTECWVKQYHYHHPMLDGSFEPFLHPIVILGMACYCSNHMKGFVRGYTEDKWFSGQDR